MPKQLIKPKIGLFAGSFDPISFGHIDVINRSLKLVDELIIAIGVQHEKSALFSPDERIKLIEETIASPKLKLVIFDGLLVDVAKKHNVDFLIRSIRNGQDFEYEKTLAVMNEQLSGIETINLFANPQFSHISSSIIRQIARMNGDVSKFVPSNIVTVINKKLKV